LKLAHLAVHSIVGRQRVNNTRLQRSFPQVKTILVVNSKEKKHTCTTSPKVLDILKVSLCFHVSQPSPDKSKRLKYARGLWSSSSVVISIHHLASKFRGRLTNTSESVNHRSLHKNRNESFGELCGRQPVQRKRKIKCVGVCVCVC
jgi:hypothetical protein